MEKMVGKSRFNGKRATPSSSWLRHSFAIEFDRSSQSFLFPTKQRSKLNKNDMKRAKM